MKRPTFLINKKPTGRTWMNPEGDMMVSTIIFKNYHQGRYKSSIMISWKEPIMVFGGIKLSWTSKVLYSNSTSLEYLIRRGKLHLIKIFEKRQTFN